LRALTVNGAPQEMRKLRTFLRVERTENLIFEGLLRGFGLMQRLTTLFGHGHDVSTSIGGIAPTFYETRRL
jgi:hypothetical protein